MKHKILFVDDESHILAALKRLFFLEPYEVLLAGSGPEALDLLKETSVTVIVSDIRMPEMDGVAFLKESARLCPDSIRMALSGYADINAIMEAINDGGIWRYIAKPWQDEDLILSVRNAVQIYEYAQKEAYLLAELEEKNLALADMNNILAEKVRERTWELEARNDILNMIIEDHDIEAVLNKICEVISRISASGPIHIVVPHMNRTFSNSPQRLSQDMEEDAFEAARKNRNSFSDGSVLMPLARGDTVLGVLVVGNKGRGEMERLSEAVAGHAAIITLALSQKKAMDDAPALIHSIDRLLLE